jgi:hypothetical protein
MSFFFVANDKEAFCQFEQIPHPAAAGFGMTLVFGGWGEEAAIRTPERQRGNSSNMTS